MMPLRSWIAVFLLSLIAFGVFALLERLEQNTKRPSHVVLPPTDYQFEQVEYNALDRKGRLRLALYSQMVTHARDEKTLTVTRPKIIRLANGDASYQLTANNAKVFDQGKRVDLLGAVSVNSLPGQTNDDHNLSFQTESLILHPEQRLAETKDRVNAQQNDTALSGTGLVANFQTDVMEIKSDVQARIPRRPR